MAPVYIDKLFCDGDTGTCFAKLVSNPLFTVYFSSIDIDIVCHVDLWRWKLGGRVGHQHLPRRREPLLSPEYRAQ